MTGTIRLQAATLYRHLDGSRGILLAVSVLVTGSPGAAAQNRPASYPIAVAATPSGVIYVADRALPGIWKIEGDNTEVYFQADRKFRTPLNAVRCVAVDAQGRLLAGDSATREVYRFEDGKPIPLTGGGIGIPMAIAVAADGTLHVADTEVHRIWTIPASGGKPEPSTTAIAARGLAFDDDGALWVVSGSNSDGQVLRITADRSTQTIVTDRPFQYPHNIVPGPEGTAFVSDNYAAAVWKIDSEGGTEKWIAGEPLVKPVGLARNGDTVLVADPHAHAVFSVTSDGTITKLFGK